MVLPQQKFLENLKFLQLEFFLQIVLAATTKATPHFDFKIGKTMKASTIESSALKQLQIATFFVGVAH